MDKVRFMTFFSRYFNDSLEKKPLIVENLNKKVLKRRKTGLLMIELFADAWEE